MALNTALAVGLGLANMIANNFFGRSNANYQSQLNVGQQMRLMNYQQKLQIEAASKLGVGATAQQLRDNNLSVSMMYGKGGMGGYNQVPAAPAVNNQVPFSPMDLASLAMQNELVNSQVNKNNADAEGQDIDNKYKDEQHQLELLSRRYDIDLQKLDIKQKNLVIRISEVDAWIKENTKNEERTALIQNYNQATQELRKLTAEAEIVEKEKDNWDEAFRNKMNNMIADTNRSFAEAAAASAAAVLDAAKVQLTAAQTELTASEAEKLGIDIKKAEIDLDIKKKDLDFYNTDKVVGYITAIGETAANIISAFMPKANINFGGNGGPK